MSQAAHPLQLETTLQLFWCHFSAESLGCLSAPSPYISPCNRCYVKYRVANWQQQHLHTLLRLEPRCKGPFASAHSAVKGV